MYTLIFITMSCLTTCKDINTGTTAIPVSFKTEESCYKEGEKLKKKYNEMAELPMFEQKTRTAYDFVCTKTD